MKISMLSLFLIFSPFLKAEVYKTCLDEETKQNARSVELADLYKQDQADRPGNVLKPDAPFRDRQRRERVGSIFGEGCFKTAQDYHHAAMIFQHGDHPDHFFQTFMWSKRGVELGDKNQKRTMALGLDRYLHNVGKKQLFGSQATKDKDDPCWCLVQVEPTFSEEMRKEYFGSTIEEQLIWVDSLNAGTKCGQAKFCEKNLAPSPKGTVLGFW